MQEKGLNHRKRTAWTEHPQENRTSLPGKEQWAHVSVVAVVGIEFDAMDCVLLVDMLQEIASIVVMEY